MNPPLLPQENQSCRRSNDGGIQTFRSPWKYLSKNLVFTECSYTASKTVCPLPWCLFPDTMDMWTTIFINDVACDTCQCSPVAVAEAGIPRRSMTKFLTERKLTFTALKWRSYTNAKRAHKLFWFWYHCAPPPPGMYGSASARRCKATSRRSTICPYQLLLCHWN